MASEITASSNSQVRTLRHCSDDNSDNVDNDTDSNTNSNANATNADNCDMVNRKMNPEEEKEEDRKKSIIFNFFRSEHIEEVRTSFEITYERLSYYHASIALAKHIDWIRFDYIRFDSFARSHY